MKRVLLAGATALTLAGCGGSSTVGANSSESSEITAVGNIVANAATPAPTPVPTAADTPATVGNDSVTANDDDPSPADETTGHRSDDGGDTVRQD